MLYSIYKILELFFIFKMPLHFTWECCKCKSSDSQSLWAISRNHKYSGKRYVCSHFDINIDTISHIGFLGIGWSNEITVTVTYKKNDSRKTLIDRTFNKKFMDYQNYVIFDKIVIHGRVSDYRSSPTVGYSIQRDIEYNEERQRREEQRRQYERDKKLQLAKLMERGNDNEEKENLKEEEQRKTNKKRNRLHQRHTQIQLNYDQIFDVIYEKQIAKSNNI